MSVETADRDFLENVYVQARRLLEECPGCSMPPFLDACEGDGPTMQQDCACFPLRKAVRDLEAWRMVRGIGGAGPNRGP